LTVRAKAVLQAANQGRISIALGEGEQASIGYGAASDTPEPEQPSYDLGGVLPAEDLDKIAVEHAVLTFKEGDFWIKALDGYETRIGPIVVVPGHYFRLVHGDTLKIGSAELTFYVRELGENPSQLARASAAD
jgi:hypothetical protein